MISQFGFSRSIADRLDHADDLDAHAGIADYEGDPERAADLRTRAARIRETVRAWQEETA